jgi:hypothetical protein
MDMRRCTAAKGWQMGWNLVLIVVPMRLWLNSYNKSCTFSSGLGTSRYGSKLVIKLLCPNFRVNNIKSSKASGQKCVSAPSPISTKWQRVTHLTERHQMQTTELDRQGISDNDMAA